MEDNDLILDTHASDLKEKRPVFLAVLCILTWVWSGLVDVVSGLYQYFTYDIQLKIYNQTSKSRDLIMEEAWKDMPDDNEAGREFVRNFTTNIFDATDEVIKVQPTLNLIQIGCGLLCILGAFLMWKLNKLGFIIYLIATIAYVAIPISILTGNMLVVATYLSFGVFGIAFIIMYGVNLKHMK